MAAIAVTVALVAFLALAAPHAQAKGRGMYYEGQVPGLQSDAKLEGVVSSASGSPVAGAWIQIATYLPPDVLPAVPEDSGDYLWYAGAAANATTDADGRYQIAAYAGPATVTVRSPGYVTVQAPREIETGSTRLDVSLLPRPPSTAQLEIVVHMPEGAPPLATLRATIEQPWFESMDCTPDHSIQSPEDTECRLRFANGRVTGTSLVGPAIITVDASAECNLEPCIQIAPWSTTLSLVEGENRIEADLASVDGQHVRGFVLDAAGRPVSGIQVSLEHVWLGTQTAPTNATGWFNFGAVAGPFIVDIRAPGFLAYRASVESPAEIEIRLMPDHDPFPAEVKSSQPASGTTHADTKASSGSMVLAAGILALFLSAWRRRSSPL
jgi:hypothetical protein